MKDMFKGIGIFLIIVVVMLGVGYGMGWYGVGYTKTVGKAQQNAETEVFESSNAFVKAKKQEILKAYKEYHSTTDEQERKAIAYTLSLSLADFDEDKYIQDYKLLQWVKQIKY